MRVFQKLSEIFSDENNYSLSRELLVKVRWASLPCQSSLSLGRPCHPLCLSSLPRGGPEPDQATGPKGAAQAWS